MHIPRDIRKKLESSLPGHVLDFLTEKFVEYETNCEKTKELENENRILHLQLHQILTNTFGNSPQVSARQGGFGYNKHLREGGEFMNAYRPWEHEEWLNPHYKAEGSYSEMRRGVPGSAKSRYEFNTGGGSQSRSDIEPHTLHEERIVPLNPEP